MTLPQYTIEEALKFYFAWYKGSVPCSQLEVQGVPPVSLIKQSDNNAKRRGFIEMPNEEA